MKSLVKVVAAILAVFTLAACGNKNSGVNQPLNNQITTQMTTEENAVAQKLEPLYNDLYNQSFEQGFKDINSELNAALMQSAKAFEGKKVTRIIVKEAGAFENGKVYCVALVYDGTVLINDTVFIENDKIVIQCIYADDLQTAIMDTYEALLLGIEATFLACNEELLPSVSPVSTFLSASLELQSLKDKDGNRVTYLEEGDNQNKVNGMTQEEDGSSQTASFVDLSAPASKGNRKLVWNHEFNVSSTGQLFNHLTNEKDHMFTSDSNLKTSMGESNYFVKDGNLVLRITSDGNKNYTTARSVSTYNKMSFKYGYLEMRAKIPYKMGVWPGFWMKSDDNLRKSKYGGEIDIFEVFASEDTCVPNLHKWYGGSASDQIGNRGKFTGQRKYIFKNSNNLSNAYHVYGFEWTPQEMKFYVDGNCYYTVSITEADDYSTAHPGMDCFHDYYYVCFNNWVFNEQHSWMNSSAYVENLPDFGTVDYTIDYVRLYQGSGEYIKIY